MNNEIRTNAAQRIHDAFNRGVSCGYIYVPTGMGKSHIIESIVVDELKYDNVISSLYVTPRLEGQVDHITANGYALEQMMLVCNNPEYVDCYEQVIGDKKPLYNVIPDKGDFRRRIRPNRVMCEDHYDIEKLQYSSRKL